MGKYIKYFNNSAELSDWLNFGIPEAPGESAETAWVAYLNNSGYNELFYSSNDNSDYFIQAYFSECSYSSSTATFNINKTGSYSTAEVYYDDTLIGTANLPWLQQFTINVGVNDTPAPKQLVATVKFYRDSELIGTKVVTGEQSADPSLVPHAYATLTIVSDGINESKIGRNNLQQSASKVTCGSTDITQGWYESNGSMCYVFPDAGTYNVTIEYNSLSFMPNLSNTDATDVRYWTNNPEYAAQMGYELTGYVGDSPNITGVTIGDGLQVITTPPFISMTNLKEMVFEDTSKLPALESWQFMMAPSGVTAYADENAENYDVWTAGTANSNWTWKPNPISTPLTFDITSPGQIKWGADSGTKAIEYSLNGGAWTSLSGN